MKKGQSAAWKYGRGRHRRKSDGRLYVTGRDRSCVPFARIVLAAKLGRDLFPDEHAHHINGDPTDDRPENLELLDPSEHQKIHDHGWQSSRWIDRICARCKGSHDELTPGCEICRTRFQARRRRLKAAA